MNFKCLCFLSTGLVSSFGNSDQWWIRSSNQHLCRSSDTLWTSDETIYRGFHCKFNLLLSFDKYFAVVSSTGSYKFLPNFVWNFFLAFLCPLHFIFHSYTYTYIFKKWNFEMSQNFYKCPCQSHYLTGSLILYFF